MMRMRENVVIEMSECCGVFPRPRLDKAPSKSSAQGRVGYPETLHFRWPTSPSVTIVAASGTLPSHFALGPVPVAWYGGTCTIPFR